VRACSVRFYVRSRIVSVGFRPLNAIERDFVRFPKALALLPVLNSPLSEINTFSPMTKPWPPSVVDQLNHVVLSNILTVIRNTAYATISSFEAYCAQLEKDIKFLSEVLICLHFSQPKHSLTPILFDELRGILLHPYLYQAVSLNPLLGHWLLNAIALLQDRYSLSKERAFMLDLVRRYGLHSLDVPSYRVEENRYLLAKLTGQYYAPPVDQAYERNFYRLSRDQIYALTHLLFYVSDYGMSRYSCSSERKFALEHLIYDAYLKTDVDVMLELMIVYRACEQSDEESAALFEKLLLKLIKKSPDLHHAMTALDSAHFNSHYHQCLLAVIYGRLSTGIDIGLILPAFRTLRAAHAFHIFLRLGNYVKVAQKFASLPTLDYSRQKFCRGNLEHYLALRSHRLDVMDQSIKKSHRAKNAHHEIVIGETSNGGAVTAESRSPG
jgi:hypothetical protein